MPYQTLVVNSFSSLHQAIRSFLIANGWADESANVVSRGRVVVKLEDNASWNGTGWLRAWIAKSSDGAGNLVDTIVAPAHIYGRLAQPTFPMTAYLHLHPTRNEFACALNYGGDQWEHLLFGELVRATEYPGGVYLFGSGGAASDGAGWQPIDIVSLAGLRKSLRVCLSTYDDRSAAAPSVTPFAVTQKAYGGKYFSGSGVWAEPGDELLAGKQWFGAATNSYTNEVMRGLSNHLSTELFERSINSWNQSVTMIPMLLSGNKDNLKKQLYLGQPDNLRYVNMCYLNPGQILTLGSERWAVYPAESKGSSMYPGLYKRTSGWIGIAVRLDDGS